MQCLTEGRWSLSEVVHAMVLLSHFHSLSSFVFSCGLTQKLDGLSSPKLKGAPVSLPLPLPSSRDGERQTTTSPTYQQPQQQKNILGEISLNNSSASGGGGGGGGGSSISTKPDYNNAADNNNSSSRNSGASNGFGQHYLGK